MMYLIKHPNGSLERMEFDNEKNLLLYMNGRYCDTIEQWTYTRDDYIVPTIDEVIQLNKGTAREDVWKRIKGRIERQTGKYICHEEMRRIIRGMSQFDVGYPEAIAIVARYVVERTRATEQLKTSRGENFPPHHLEGYHDHL